MSGAGKLAPVLAGLVVFLAVTADAQRPDAPQPAQIEQSITKWYIEKQVPPKYPEKAREMRVQGAVVLKVILSKKGKIKEITVVSGHPLLVPAAMDAVKQWKYKPYRVQGHAVEAWTDVVVNFTLEK